ncbi:MAG: CoA-binding protein [Thermoplasmataceae archaeon]
MKIEDDNGIREILRVSKNIAVVGISEKHERDSFKVAQYLSTKGYNIIPINPAIENWNGIKSYPNLSSIPKDMRIDIVDVFRKSEAVPEIVNESLKIKPKAIWLQLGVINEDAAKKASESGMKVVMDRCIMVEHKKLMK